MDVIENDEVLELCLECGSTCYYTTGEEIYPHREDLHHLPFIRCPVCPDSYCGCHIETGLPFGYAVGKKTRDARCQLHKLRFDPIWKNAKRPNLMRKKLYEFLKVTLNVSNRDAHIGALNIEQCRRMWVALNGVNERNIVRKIKYLRDKNEQQRESKSPLSSDI